MSDLSPRLPIGMRPSSAPDPNTLPSKLLVVSLTPSPAVQLSKTSSPLRAVSCLSSAHNFCLILQNYIFAGSDLVQCFAGSTALEYFESNNPGAEPMQEGSNEAEWIVDLTTHADRDDMCTQLSFIALNV